MGLPICLFAYGANGLGVAGAISSLIILFHFTLGVFLASKKFNLEVIIKSPAFYSVIISIIFLYFEHDSSWRRSNVCGLDYGFIQRKF